MTYNDIEEKIVDFIEGRLSQEETQLFEDHIKTCKDSQRLLKETQQLLQTFKEVPEQRPSEKVRTSFYQMLEKEKQSQSKVIPLVQKANISWKTAFQIAASFLLLFTGYFVGTSKMQKAQSEIVKLQLETQQMKQNMLLAMIDNRSPSKRIKAVNYTEEFERPDESVLVALIDRLKYDTNSNVRLAAAEALSKFSKEEIVRTTLIETLVTEKNPSIQIEIIHILVRIQDKRALVPMQKLLEQPETPDYVRDQVSKGMQTLI